MQISLVDLHAQYHSIRPEIMAAIEDVLGGMQLFLGPLDTQPVLDFAPSHSLHVIEDASRANGATNQGQRVGSMGDIGCFSLYFSKNLVHLHPACSHYGYVRGMLPVTASVTERIVSLPMYPELTPEQLQTAVNAVKKSIVLGASSL